MPSLAGCGADRRLRALDLIIGHIGWLESVYDELAELAPTVVSQYDCGSEGKGAMWRRPVRTVARAVGREVRGESVLAEIDAELENARERLFGLADLKVSENSALEGWQAYFTPKSYPGYMLERLGLSQPEPQTEIPSGVSDPQQIEFSNERLDILDGDVAFCLNFGEDEFLDDWETRPLLPVSGRGRVRQLRPPQRDGSPTTGTTRP